MSVRPRVVYFERWAHPVALERIAALTHLDVERLSPADAAESLWQAFARAHVYQIRSTRSELPPEFTACAQFLARCPSLLAISTQGSGADTVDLDACTAAGVIVVNQAGGNREAVAEHAMGMMLCLTKRIMESDRAMRTAAGVDRHALMGHDLHGCTLGIVGLGAVGTRMAELARAAFAMRVIAFDPFLCEQDFHERGAAQVDFATLLAEADFVSVHCPRNASSERMFDAAAFRAMKRNAYFVTTARGGIHDEQALAQALLDGAIAGAGLDVWDPEPPAPDHPLLALPNVVASPHTAGVTHEARTNMALQTVAQIDDIVRGRRPPRLLNPEAWDVYAERFERILGRRPEG